MTGRFSICAGLAILLTGAAQAQTQVPAQTPAQAPAQACPPLTKFTGVKLERLPNSRRVLVPVEINGVTKKFLLDTAGMGGLITKEAAGELKLDHAFGVQDLKKVKTFGLGGTSYELPDTGTTETTLLSSQYPVNADRDGDIDGTLTPGFLFNKGELDIDFPGGTLSLFSPDHCPGKVNYWGAPDIGYLPLSHAPLEFGQYEAQTDRWDWHRSGVQRWEGSRLVKSAGTADIAIKNDIAHLTVPVTLDGHTLNAWIDTSAEKSSISLEVAERIFKLPREGLGPTSQVKVTPEAALGFYDPHILGYQKFSGSPANETVAKATAYRHKFAGLSVGHVDIKNLELLIYPDNWGRNNDPERALNYTPKVFSARDWDSDIAGQGANRGEKSNFSNAKKDVPDMVLGMDVLSHLHIFISLKDERMYFSVGAAPAPAAAAAAAPAAAAQKAAAQ
jgi:hypothetical protein